MEYEHGGMAWHGMACFAGGYSPFPWYEYEYSSLSLSIQT